MKRYYVGRKQDGTMHSFPATKKGLRDAEEYTDNSVALYEGKGDSELTFVRVMSIKASAEDCANLLMEGATK